MVGGLDTKASPTTVPSSEKAATAEDSERSGRGDGGETELGGAGLQATT